MTGPTASRRHGAPGATILFVCEGNVCRSPLAETLLRHRLLDLGVDGVAVSSAGTRARVGDEMDPGTVAVAVDLGIQGVDHEARQVTAEMIAEADLVLTASRALRSAVTTLHPRALGYTFTIRQLGRILEEITEDLEAVDADGPMLPDLTAMSRLRSLVALARRARGQHFVADPADEDVLDPWGRGARAQQAAAEQIEPAIASIVRVLSEGREESVRDGRSDVSA